MSTITRSQAPGRPPELKLFLARTVGPNGVVVWEDSKCERAVPECLVYDLLGP